jgi:hypothetical protein
MDWHPAQQKQCDYDDHQFHRFLQVMRTLVVFDAQRVTAVFLLIHVSTAGEHADVVDDGCSIRAFGVGHHIIQIQIQIQVVDNATVEKRNHEKRYEILERKAYKNHIKRHVVEWVILYAAFLKGNGVFGVGIIERLEQVSRSTLESIVIGHFDEYELWQ